MADKRLATGKFKNRQELVDHILSLYYDTSCSVARIARNSQVAEPTVSNIIRRNK